MPRVVQLGMAYALVILAFGNFFRRAQLFHHHRRSLQKQQPSVRPPRNRLLYIVTSMNEYDTGRRETVKGYDRFNNTILPIMVESITSMMQQGYDVDAYLITHYPLSQARLDQLSVALPCAFQVWDEATPLAYATEHSREKIQDHTRGLSRQHRYVIKDRYFDYDFFVNFEDDMLIKGEHVEHFVDLTDELYRLRQGAFDKYSSRIRVADVVEQFHGEMSQMQLQRLIPGFIRVEAAIPGFEPHQENLYEKIPVDYEWMGQPNAHMDPTICCHVSEATANDHIPRAPSNDDLYFWETSIDVLGVRKLPERSIYDWVVFLGGNKNDLYRLPHFALGDYWSGRGQDYFKEPERPDRTKGRYMSNQGGWMATRRQIFEWHNTWCRGSFLPPYDPPTYELDGLNSRPVEYWSGGIQIAGTNACNLQRIVSLNPQDFSKHLLYHTSNNKQRAKQVRHRFSSRTVDQFWGQLNTIRKNAEKERQKEIQAVARMKELKKLQQ